jgi:glycine/D-amino acid oxidase-like deaminating enzyme/nitrite reductase/ring-hydroxylating ferredoxin subunit
MPNYTNSLWTPTVEERVYPRLDQSLAVDVAIIGAGVTGVTAARLLKNAGLKVALVESRRIGKGESGKTTAHLTQCLDTRYHTLISRFGLDGAKATAASQNAAINRIASFVEELHIDCQFDRLPGYLFAEDEGAACELEKEEEAAAGIGLGVESATNLPLPFPVVRALRFPNQAQLHPRRYLLGLADGIDGNGCHIFEDTQVLNIQDQDHGEDCRLVTERGVLRARDVIVAAHVPISDKLLLATKLAAYRSYAVAVALSDEGPKGLFWDTTSPYHYIRWQRVDGVCYLIVGGEDHKVGEADDTRKPFQRLEEYVAGRFGQTVKATDFRWSGQIIEPADGLPYIGRSPGMDHIYVATGYSGNGMTSGTLAGMLLSDELLGKANPWRDLYDATRFKPVASAKNFVEENVTFPKHMLADRLKGLEGADALETLAPNEGRLVKIDGEKLAVYKNTRGEIVAVSPVCTHLGCLVNWNTAEKSWDCACHGSRFDPQGRVLNGPATSALQPRELFASTGKKSR